MKVIKAFMSGREPGRVYQPGEEYTPASVAELRAFVTAGYLERPPEAKRPARKPREAPPAAPTGSEGAPEGDPAPPEKKRRRRAPRPSSEGE